MSEPHGTGGHQHAGPLRLVVPPLQPMLERVPGGAGAPSVRFAATPPGRRPPIRLALAVGLLSTAGWLVPVLGIAVSAAAVGLGLLVIRRSRALQGFDPGGGRLVVRLGVVSGLLAVAVTLVLLLHRDALARFQDCSAGAVGRVAQDACLHRLEHDLAR